MSMKNVVELFNKQKTLKKRKKIELINFLFILCSCDTINSHYNIVEDASEKHGKNSIHF